MSLREVIKHSVAATESENAMQLRQEQVRLLKPMHVRIALQSIDTAVFAIPKMKHALDRVAMERNGLSLIGSGAEARVYSDGETVLKYVYRSEEMSRREKETLSDQKKLDFEQLQKHMSAFVLDQDISIAPHAAKRGKEVVQTVQPHVTFDSLVNREGNDGGVSLHAAPTHVLDGLSDFLDASWDLYGKTGLLPDTNGTDNIVQVDNGLLLIDTQPITLKHEEVQRVVMRQLGSIAAELEKTS